MNFTIDIDNREPNNLKSLFNFFENVNIYFANLNLGDFILKQSHNEIEKILTIIERKSISDLFASIKDNRYHEQAIRYNQTNIPIYYIIEGNKNQIINDTEYKQFYSSIISLTYKYKFNVIFTNNINDTYNVINILFNKIIKLELENSDNNTNNNLCNQNILAKKPKVTKNDYPFYCLNLIPGISLSTAKQILSQFDNSITNLKNKINENPDVLNEIKINKRKLNKNVIHDIKDFLLNF